MPTHPVTTPSAYVKGVMDTKKAYKLKLSKFKLKNSPWQMVSCVTMLIRETPVSIYREPSSECMGAPVGHKRTVSRLSAHPELNV